MASYDFRNFIPSRYHSKRVHISYGIQNWLYKNDFCVNSNGKSVHWKCYAILLNCFNTQMSNRKRSIPEIERYIDNRFHVFKKWVKENYEYINFD